MHWLRRNWPLLVAGILAITLGAGLGVSRLTAGAPHSLDPLWSTRLVDLRGNPVALETLRGKPLIINFWATWCGPCKDEMPDFQRLATENSDKNIQIIGIGIDNGDHVPPKCELLVPPK